MSETDNSSRKKVIDEILVLLRDQEARYHYHSDTMDPMYAKDTVNGQIKAIQTAIRSVSKLT